MKLSSQVIVLSAVTAVSSLAVTSQTLQADMATPIAATGWNADVVYAANSPTDVAQGFDGTHAWDAAGAGTTDGSNDNNGLPSDQYSPTNPYTFTSSMANQINSSNTSFQFQSFIGNNVLYLNGANSLAQSTLTLAAPAAYNNLAILAASASSSVKNGLLTASFVLHFTDGSTSAAINYDPYDWGAGYSNSTADNLNALPNRVDRSAASGGTEASTFYPADSAGQYYNMYESDINLLNSSNYANKLISSISFNAPSSGDIGIFAISGVVNPTPVVLAPEPAPLAALLCALTGMLLLGRRKTHG